MRALGLTVGAVLLGFVGAVQAQETPAPTAPTATTPPVAPAAAPTTTSALTPDEWWTQYRAARALMAQGSWEAAASAFEALAGNAPDAPAGARAGEDAALCRSFIERGLVLIPRADLGESTVHARQANVRTTDEIAVLYTNAVFYGVGTGAWLAIQTEPESAAGAILPALGLAGGAALGVYALDSGKPLGYGVPQSMVTGMYIGLYEGIAWTVFNQSQHRYSESWSGETVATMIWGGATVGLAAGGIVGTARGTTPGRASFVGSASLWSAVVAGFLTSAVVPKDDKQDDRTWLAVALGVNAGAIGGALAAGGVSPTVARVRFLDLGGIAGLLAAGGLFIASESDDDTARDLAISGGAAAGLAVAWFATQGMPKDEPTKPATVGGVAMPNVSLMPVRGGATLGLHGFF